MVSPQDFFKSMEDVEDARTHSVLLHYTEKIIKKYFVENMSRKQLRDIIYDAAIEDEDKLYAIREVAEGILSTTTFSTDKADLRGLMKKGLKHPVIKRLFDAFAEEECTAVVFPIYKTGNWVAHLYGEPPDAIKKPRIVIPGNGNSITIQDIDSFILEHQ